jgi:hypothetical protein|tara:strand:+ start:1703 stop:2413 length:711 start_codon:yes stop_codon:yes gene_type:complete
MIKLLLSLLLAATSVNSVFATVLIGSDIANVGNGNFNNDNPSIKNSFEETPDWINLSTSDDQLEQATGLGIMIDLTFDDTSQAILSNDKSKVFGSEFGSTGYTVAAGDVFDLEYVWRDRLWWNDEFDRVAVTLFVTDDNTINGIISPLVVDFSDLNASADDYELVDHDGFYTATDDFAGKKLFLSFEVQAGDGTETFREVGRLDNLKVEVFSAVPEPSRIVLLGSAFLFAMRRQRR